MVMASTGSVAELVNAVMTIEERVEDLKVLPPELLHQIKQQAMDLVSQSRIRDGGDLARFVVEQIKRNGHSRSMIKDPGMNPFAAFGKVAPFNTPTPFYDDDEPNIIASSGITTTALPEINKSDLDKLDAIVAIMGGNLGIKIADIYKAAQDFEQEAKDLKKKIEAGKEPVGIKAMTAQVGIIHMDWHDRLATDVKLGRTIAVRGPAGNGKSTGIKGVLESAGYTIYHLDCTDSTTVDQLIGGLEPVPDGKGGIKMQFKEGVFARAFNDEKGAVQLDEFDALDPRITMALQSALHRAAVGKKRTVSCPDHAFGSLVAAGDCPIVVSMNTWGTGATREYVGRNAIDAASLDRFDTIINTDYQCEAEMLEKMGLAPTDRAKLLKEVFSLRKKIQEKGLRVLLSTRRVLNMGECVLALNCTVPKAISREFVERLDEYDRAALNLNMVK